MMGAEATMTAPSLRTILVVEDDPTVSDILRILLEDDGFRIVTALSGREALELAWSDPPNLITLDLNLPDMDGYRLLDELRNQPGGQEIPIVVVSGRQYEPRPDDHVVAALPKPFDATELDEVVRRTLGAPHR